MRQIEQPSIANNRSLRRLGKRFDGPAEPLERLLCASSPDCGRRALLGALAREIVGASSTRPHSPAPLSMVEPQIEGPFGVMGEPNGELGQLLDLYVDQQRLPRRETRALVDMAGDLIGAGGDGGLGPGAKRVAFTPRIGRR